VFTVISHVVLSCYGNVVRNCLRFFPGNWRNNASSNFCKVCVCVWCVCVGGVCVWVVCVCGWCVCVGGVCVCVVCVCVCVCVCERVCGVFVNLVFGIFPQITVRTPFW